jgi:NAD(P)-dependent dehydrogenase (short-subunit alcohol dehydrogenase family)
MGRLTGKSVVVTGGARGLGAAYAKAIIAEGGNLVLNDIDEAPCLDLAGQLKAAGGRVAAHIGDVASWDFAGDLIERSVEEFGRIDGLVNNAGTLVISPIEEHDGNSFRKQIEANLIGSGNCGLHALKKMLAQGHGSVVNTLSGAQAGSPFRCAYSAATAGISGLTSSWAAECAGRGVRINAIGPIAYTREFDYSESIFGRLYEQGRYPKQAWDNRNRQKQYTPEQNAPMVVFLLSDASEQLNGQIMRLEGKSLMLLTRPVARAPMLTDDWTVEKIEQAFAGPLKDATVPLGLQQAEIRFMGKLA